MTRKAVFGLLALAAIVSTAALAQDSAKKMPARAPKSPHETISATFGGQQVTISYGRPSLRGRKAVGGTLVPYGEVWRLGADSATKLTTPVSLTIGNLTVPAGSYALFTIATETGWTLIVNKTADQWGAFDYDKAQDFGRVPMTVTQTSAPLEQFTMALEKTGDKTANLTLAWENIKASVSVTAQ